MNDYEKEQCNVEIKTLENLKRNLDHPNILKIFEYIQTDKKVAIVTEICEGGELFDEFVTKGKFSEQDTAYFKYKNI